MGIRIIKKWTWLCICCNKFIFQLENKVASLEQELIQTLEEKRRIQEELQLLKSNSQKLQSSNKYSDPMVTIEQLSEVLPVSNV